jgi:hypothetical protein
MPNRATKNKEQVKQIIFIVLKKFSTFVISICPVSLVITSSCKDDEESDYEKGKEAGDDEAASENAQVP